MGKISALALPLVKYVSVWISRFVSQLVTSSKNSHKYNRVRSKRTPDKNHQTQSHESHAGGEEPGGGAVDDGHFGRGKAEDPVQGGRVENGRSLTPRT